MDDYGLKMNGNYKMAMSIKRKYYDNKNNHDNKCTYDKMINCDNNRD